MDSKSTVRMLSRAILLAAGLLAGFGGEGLAATLSSGPLRVAALDSYSCAAVNVGRKDISAEVVVTIDGGGNGAAQSCTPLLPKSVCATENDAGSASYRYCTITTSSRKGTRGTFCNKSLGICIPVQ